MRKTTLLLMVFSAISLIGCKKNNEAEVSLTASATQVTVGQTVSVTLTTNANVSEWTVSPSVAVSKTYSLTTNKINYFTFNQPGTYMVGVRVKNVAYDSTTHQSLDSCWNHSGANRGNCTRGKDSAFVSIVVSK